MATFDMKGSSANRSKLIVHEEAMMQESVVVEGLFSDRLTNLLKRNKQTLLDNDFVWLQSHFNSFGLFLKDKDIAEIHKSLKADCEYLSQNDLMDYSILIGIEKIKDNLVENKVYKTFMSENGKFVYHISIIDYLQKYNFTKKSENFIKVNLLRKENHSYIDPGAYARRFLKFMSRQVLTTCDRETVEKLSLIM